MRAVYPAAAGSYAAAVGVVGLALALGALALWVLGRGLLALRERRALAGAFRGLWAALLLCAAGLLASLSFSLQGYRALSREVVAAYIEVRPTGPERFLARVEEPGGLRLAGPAARCRIRLRDLHRQ